MNVETCRARLNDEGWCVIPNVLEPARAADIFDRLWSAAAESRRRGAPTRIGSLDPNEHNVRVFNLLDLDPVFRDLIQHPLAVDLVTGQIGPSFLISNFTANIARPGSRSMKAHSDQSLVVPEPWEAPWAMNVIWCLTDCRGQNGATLFLPGSHRFSRRADLPANLVAGMIPFEAPAGSIIAMDGRLWHTSGANVTANEDRALLFGYYSAAFLRPQVNWNATLSAETQAGLSTPMRAWLGLEATANIGRASDIDITLRQEA